MKKKVTRFYYSLSDLIDSKMFDYSEGPFEFVGTILRGAEVTDKTLASFTQLDTSNPTAVTMFHDYLIPEYSDAFVFYVDVECAPWEEPDEPETEDILEAASSLCTKMYRWLVESCVRYSLLISQFESVKSSLMNKLSSDSLTLFNDTPQAGGDYTSDPYVTNATKVTTNTEVATPIERLREIQTKLRNLYADWADEFSRYVIYSAE